jgi:hypothetical protein
MRSTDLYSPCLAILPLVDLGAGRTDNQLTLASDKKRITVHKIGLNEEELIYIYTVI